MRQRPEAISPLQTDTRTTGATRLEGGRGFIPEQSLMETVRSIGIISIQPKSSHQQQTASIMRTAAIVLSLNCSVTAAKRSTAVSLAAVLTVLGPSNARSLQVV